MIINCEICKIKVGEIMEGSLLKKGTVFLCRSCELKRNADKFKDKSLFNDIFGNNPFRKGFL